NVERSLRRKMQFKLLGVLVGRHVGKSRRAVGNANPVEGFALHREPHGYRRFGTLQQGQEFFVAPPRGNRDPGRRAPQAVNRYRVMRANSGSAAITTLRELKARNNPVALLLADQRMPQMDGVGFLSEAMELHPLAKRALLTAYADTSAAIDAINAARVHYYFMKPWDPPEEKLYPALDDLLHDWSSTFRPPYEGIRVLGTRWSNRSYELRDFLARNQVPYQWIDVE